MISCPDIVPGAASKADQGQLTRIRNSRVMVRWIYGQTGTTTKSTRTEEVRRTTIESSEVSIEGRSRRTETLFPKDRLLDKTRKEFIFCGASTCGRICIISSTRFG